GAFVALITKIQPTLEAVERPGGPRRIYLARKETQHRRIQNRREVEPWFEANGFTIFDFEELSFREQVALVRGADLIVGPDGSSLLSTFFARPGIRIGILTNAFAEECEWYMLVCRALGQQLAVLAGAVARKDTGYRMFSNYRIDVER